MREETGAGLSLRTFKQILRQQFFMLIIDERAALNAIPSMLEHDPKLASIMKGKLDRLIETTGLQTTTAISRRGIIDAMFDKAHDNPAALAAPEIPAVEVRAAPIQEGPQLPRENIKPR